MPQAGAGLRSPSRAALRVYTSLGNLGLLLVSDAARRLPLLRRDRRRGLMGRWQASIDQSLYAVSGPLGAETLLEGSCRVVSHFLGQGARRRQLRCFLGLGQS